MFLRSFSLHLSLPLSFVLPSLTLSRSFSLSRSFYLFRILLLALLFLRSSPSPSWLPEDLTWATGYKMATIATEHDIEWHTPLLRRSSTVPLYFFASVFVPLFLSSVAVSLNPIQSFDSQLRTGSISCCVASESRCTDDHATIYRPSDDSQEWRTTLQIFRFLSPCSWFSLDQILMKINTGFLSRYSRRV